MNTPTPPRYATASGSKKKEPRYTCLSEAKASQSQRMWAKVSSFEMGLCDNPICRKCGTEEETIVHVLCECEAVALLRHSYLGSFFLGPEDIRTLNIRAIWKFAKGTGLH